MRQRGFTLVELMAVVAVVAILAMIALPSYQEHVRRSRRVQAKADLMELAQLLERQFTVDRDYRSFVLAAPMNQSPRTGLAHYTLSLQTPSQTAYTLSAVPQAGQAIDACGTLTVAQTGARTPVDPRCWP